MLDDDERPDGKIRIYYVDNTYKMLPVKLDTTVNEIVEWLCKRLAVAGRPVNPKQHELFMITPGVKALREQQLLRDDRPLQIQSKGGSSACKLLFREARFVQTEEFANVAQNISEEDRDVSSVICTLTSGQFLQHEEQVGAVEAVVEDLDQHSPASAQTELSFEKPPGRLKSGSLERLLLDGQSWQSCSVFLDEDRFWYSEVPSDTVSARQCLMSVRLSDCDRVLEGEDQRVLQLSTRCSGTLAFRARSGHERSGWLVAVVKQAALVKEGDILMQAEQSIAGMEFRRSNQHLASIEAFQQVQGVMRNKRSRALFLDFVHDEHHRSGAASYADGPDERGAEGGSKGWPEVLRVNEWPEGVSVEGLVACLERRAQASPKGGADAAQVAFIEDVLFPRFRDQPLVQDRLCGIAADIGACGRLPRWT